MRLYTDNADETAVLIHALKFLRLNTSSTYTRDVCSKLVLRIEKCQELQRHEYGRKVTKK